MKPIPVFASIALLGLAGCGEKPAPAAPAADPALAQDPSQRVSDFSQPMTARGNEPFWALVMNGTNFTLKRPDHPDVAFTTPGAAIQAGRATWIATSADGQPLTVTLYISDCSDGMSDLTYPMTAEVVLRNESLRGCAMKTADLPRAGG